MRRSVLTGIALALAAPAWAQVPAGSSVPAVPYAAAPFRVRLAIATLEPGSLKRLIFAYGASVGWRVAARDALVVRWVRQDAEPTVDALDRNARRDYVSFDWEHAFAGEAVYRRTPFVRVGLGVLSRPDSLRRAPFLGLGLGVIYPVARHVGVVAHIEDNLVFLPAERVVYCQPPPGNACLRQDFAQRAEHDFGASIAFELRP